MFVLWLIGAFSKSQTMFSSTQHWEMHCRCMSYRGHSTIGLNPKHHSWTECIVVHCFKHHMLNHWAFFFAPLSLLIPKAGTKCFNLSFFHWQRESSWDQFYLLWSDNGICSGCHTSLWPTLSHPLPLLAPTSLLMATTYHHTAAIASLSYNCYFWYDGTLISPTRFYINAYV